MEYRKSMQGSRKTWCERNLLILMIAVLIGLCSCGIRPLDRPDNPIVGGETDARPNTDGLTETDAPITLPSWDTYEPGFYFSSPPYGAPGNMGTETSPKYMWYYSNAKYIEENTVGFYRIQNKKSGLVISDFTVIRDKGEENESYYLTNVVVLKELSDDPAQVIRIVKLLNGAYMLMTHSPVFPYSYTLLDQQVDMHRSISCKDDGYNGGALWITAFLYPERTIQEAHYWIIEETDSDTYRLTTMQEDRNQEPRYLMGSTEPYEATEGAVSTEQSYLMGFFRTPVASASDEWLFIPADPPETTSP